LLRLAFWVEPSLWWPPRSGTDRGDCLLQLLAEIVETIRFCRFDGRADRRDERAVGCQ
jgi:hypothetical protein